MHTTERRSSVSKMSYAPEMKKVRIMQFYDLLQLTWSSYTSVYKTYNYFPCTLVEMDDN